MNDVAEAGTQRAVPLAGGTRHLTVTYEALAYGLLAVVALAARLYRPDWMPLDPTESSVAVPAWQSVSGAHVSALSVSPLLFQAERLAFWLFGGGEGVARFVPALAGAAAVPLMFRLRGVMGHAGALGAACLLALSPLWVFYGRDVAVAPLATLSIVILLGCAVSRFPLDALMLPVAAALALAAGGLAYAFALALGVFGVVRYATGGRSTFDDDVAQLWPTDADRRLAAALFAVTLVLASTGLLTHTSGLAALVQYPATWLSQVLSAPFASSFGFGLSLAVYAPAIAILGVPGTVLAARRGTSPGSFLAVWLLVGLAVGVVGGAPVGMAAALLPLTLAAGLALGRLASATADTFRWQEDGVMIGITLVVLAYAGVQLVTFSNLADAELGSSNWTLALGALALATLLVIAYALLWGRSVAIRVAAWSVLIAVAVLAVSNGASLNYRPATALREPMRPEYALPGAQLLADSVAQVSWLTTRDPNTIETAVDPSLRPYLEWTLRDRAVAWAPVDGPATTRSLVVPAGTKVEAGDHAYRGQTHVVGGRWLVSFAGRHEFVRWLIHRRTSDVVSGVELTPADLYVQVDQLQEGDG